VFAPLRKEIVILKIKGFRQKIEIFTTKKEKATLDLFEKSLEKLSNLDLGL